MSELRTQPVAAVDRRGGTRTYCTFRLRESLFGTDTRVAKEVTALPPITPIPHAPAAVRGYVNLRGHIVLVLDLNCLLHREPTAIGPASQLVVFQPELGDAFGVLVERIGEIVELSDEQIERHHAGNAASGTDVGELPESALLRGIGKLDDELLLILEARALLPCLEKSVATRGAITNRQTPVPVKESSL